MAIVEVPNWRLIAQLARVLDFYYWKGKLVCRTYPHVVRQPGTPAQQLTWWALTRAHQDWNNLRPADKEAFRALVGPIQRTGHDQYMKEYLTSFSVPLGHAPNFYFVNWSFQDTQIWVAGSSSIPVLSQIEYGFHPTPSTPQFTQWNTATMELRGAMWRRSYKLRRLFPDSKPNWTGSPDTSHLYKLNTPGSGYSITFMLIGLYNPLQPKHMNSGLYTVDLPF